MAVKECLILDPGTEFKEAEAEVGYWITFYLRGVLVICALSIV